MKLTYELVLSNDIRALERAVAEYVFGYKTSWWSIHPISDLKYTNDPHQDCFSDLEVMLPDDKGDCPILEMEINPDCWCCIPSYTFYANEGFSILDKMAERGWLVTIRTLPPAYNVNTDKVWACRTTYQVQFRQKLPASGPDRPIIEGPTVMSDNLLEAICRAALLIFAEELGNVDSENLRREWAIVGSAHSQTQKIQDRIGGLSCSGKGTNRRRSVPNNSADGKDRVETPGCVI